MSHAFSGEVFSTGTQVYTRVVASQEKSNRTYNRMNIHERSLRAYTRFLLEQGNCYVKKYFDEVFWLNDEGRVVEWDGE